MKCPTCQDDMIGLNGPPVCPSCARKINAEERLALTTCSQCVEWRTLADDALNTLRITREKYGIGDRHVMREKNREIEKLRMAIKDATELFGEIMRDEVNHQDEAEKWLRAYAPQHLFPENAPADARPSPTPNS